MPPKLYVVRWVARHDASHAREAGGGAAWGSRWQRSGHGTGRPRESLAAVVALTRVEAGGSAAAMVLGGRAGGWRQPLHRRRGGRWRHPKRGKEGAMWWLWHREATWAAAEPTRGKDGGGKASMRGEREEREMRPAVAWAAGPGMDWKTRVGERDWKTSVEENIAGLDCADLPCRSSGRSGLLFRIVLGHVQRVDI